MTPGPAEAEITPVLVTYNSAGILPWSLPALATCRQVVIVDNHSSDDTVAVARRLLPQASILLAGRNLGFGRASNLGLDEVRSPYALLVNPDVQLGAGSLQALWHAAQRYPDAALLAPVLFDAPDVVGDSFRGPFYAPASKPPPLPAGDLCCDFVTAAAMLLNMDLMRRVGFFDPWFFLYFEDDDLCLRVRRAGHPIVVVENARMEHRVRQSSAPSARNTLRRIYFRTLSKFYITRKYFGTARSAATAARIGLGSILTLLPQLLTLRADRVVHLAVRGAAALMAWRHLRRTKCFEPPD
jgi:N-acetylglucosaminyl-diphospho-decaprenol L-rhamnosyltransferase